MGIQEWTNFLTVLLIVINIFVTGLGGIKVYVELRERLTAIEVRQQNVEQDIGSLKRWRNAVSANRPNAADPKTI